jgi:hypothetical protein
LLPALFAITWLTSCASIGPPLPPSLELPRPPTDLRATRKGDKVTLTWTVPPHTTDRQTVRYLGNTRICRSLDTTPVTCDSPLAEVRGEVPPPADFAGAKPAGKKPTATYIDTLPNDPGLRPTLGSATYAVEVLNRDNRAAGLSNQVHVPLAEVLPPPSDFNATLSAEGVVLSWTGSMLSTPAPDPLHRTYRIFRRLEGTQQNILVGERQAGAESHLSLTDQSFDWERTYYYHADTLTVISQPGKPGVSIEGDDTPEVKVSTHDVFPPAVPSGVQAVFSGPGQRPFIDLIWAPVTDADLDGYNVYRHEAGAAAVKLNSEPVKTPAFRDFQVASGHKYFYSVSAIDVRRNESARSEEASETVP